MVKLFIDKINEYKPARVFYNVSIKNQIKICLSRLEGFAKNCNLKFDDVVVSFIDYTFSNNNVKLTKLASYLNPFYDNYYNNNKLFEKTEFSEEEEIKFEKFVKCWKSNLREFYQHTVEIDKLEILKQAFKKILYKIDETEYNDFIKAQFEKLEWTGKVVSVYHLNSSNALLRYLEWKKVFKHPNSEWYNKLTKGE